MTDLTDHHRRMATIRKDHWRQYETGREHEERADAAEASAYWYFNQFTAAQSAAYRAVLADRMGLTAPRDRRALDAAKVAYEASTATARDLMAETFNEIMRDGEISESMSARWDSLCANPAQAAEAA